MKDHSWHISTIFPVTEARSSNSCARPRIAQRQPLGDHRSNGLLLKHGQQSREILAEPCGMFFLLRHDVVPARGFSGNQTRQAEPGKAGDGEHLVLASAFDGRRHSITDEASALAQCAIRSQPIAAANRIEHRIDAGGAPDEILASIIDRNAAERWPPDRAWALEAVPNIFSPASEPSCSAAVPTPPAAP